MEAEQLKFVLEELDFSAAFPAEVLEQLAEASTKQTLAAGTILFRESAIQENLYLLRSGRIALEIGVPGRGAVRILTVGPGEMVGWSALLDQGKMTTSAVTVEESEVIVAPADKLRELCDINCNFGFHLMRQMAAALSKRLMATRLQLLDVFADAPSQVHLDQSKAGG